MMSREEIVTRRWWSKGWIRWVVGKDEDRDDAGLMRGTFHGLMYQWIDRDGGVSWMYFFQKNSTTGD